MSSELKIVALTLPEPQLSALAEDARAEGHNFIDRLQTDWKSGRNRFDRSGERLLAVWIGCRLIAVGGLNRDPYADDDRIGRLRHVYVRPHWRGSGTGRHLVQSLVGAPHGFDVIRLRTSNPAAGLMYEHIGFVRCKADDTTHEISRL